MVLVLALLAGMGVPAVAGQPQLDILDAPEVVVANDPKTMADDPETEQREFNPNYVFSASARVTNDDTQRTVRAESIIYVDQGIGENCPQDRQAFPVGFIFPRLNLSAQEQMQFGGEAHRQGAEAEEYWPMAVSRTYHDARTGQNVSIEEGTHTFCAALRTTGEDPACDRQANRTCVLATAPFQSYVRRENAAPHITSMQANPSNPQPGEPVLLEAQAVDNSTEPREDSLSYAWHLGGQTKRGPSVQHSFGSERVHEVKVVVSDGFDEVNRTLKIGVGEATVDEETNGSPAVGWVASLAVVVAVAVARRR